MKAELHELVDLDIWAPYSINSLPGALNRFAAIQTCANVFPD